MQFDSFLTRADEETLQELLGQKVLRLLRAIDHEGLTLHRQRELLLQQTKPQVLLTQRKSRTVLLDLLRPHEAQQLADVLGLRTDDPYSVLRSLGGGAAKLEALLEFFELSPLDPERPAPMPDSETIQPLYSLFQHQALAARRCLEALASGTRKVLLHMPTGAGKTRTAMHVVSQYLRANPKRGVVWLAHSEELCGQAADEFARAWASLGAGELRVHRFWGSHKPDLSDIGGDFVVAGLQKIFAAARQSLGFIGRMGAQTGLVVMDEAHQAIAPTYQLILDALVEPFPVVSLLGLSATPGRTWNDPQKDQQLADFFDGRKVILEVQGYKNPVTYLIEEGYLARAMFRPLRIGGQFKLSENERERLETELEIPPEIMERLALDEVRNLAILSEVEHLTKRHRRLIVFATTVEHSDLLAYALRARGLWARSVTGATSSVDRQAALEQYKSSASETRVICNFGVLTTGFDAPQTSAAVIARPTTSLVLFSQMVGRATRGPKAGGNAEAEIVTIVDNGLPGFGDVGDAFLNWEDVWEDE